MREHIKIYGLFVLAASRMSQWFALNSKIRTYLSGYAAKKFGSRIYQKYVTG